MALATTLQLARPQLGRTVVPLLGLAVLINYVDRGNLATAAPLIKGELHLTNTQIGLLVSAFFWSYVPSHVLVAWMIERINAYRTLALGLALWGLATAASGLAMGFVSLLVLRFLLGAGESAVFPCAGRLVALHLPPDKQGAANGLIMSGVSLGPAFGTFFGGIFMAATGWRPAFLVFGLGSLLWLWPWLATTAKASAAATRIVEAPAPSVWTLVRRRDVWGAVLGQFCGVYVLYFVLSWLPLYLVKSRGFTMTEMATLSGLVYLVYAASTVISGWACDRWIAAGASVTLVRKSAIVAGYLVVAASMFACAEGDLRTNVIALFVAALAFGVNAPTLFSIAQTLAGPRVAGKWVSLQNGVANICGIVAPIVTGVVVDKTGAFTWAFLIAAAVSLLGVIGWGLMIRKVEPLDWGVQASATRVVA